MACPHHSSEVCKHSYQRFVTVNHSMTTLLLFQGNKQTFHNNICIIKLMNECKRLQICLFYVTEHCGRLKDVRKISRNPIIFDYGSHISNLTTKDRSETQVDDYS